MLLTIVSGWFTSSCRYGLIEAVEAYPVPRINCFSSTPLFVKEDTADALTEWFVILFLFTFKPASLLAFWDHVLMLFQTTGVILYNFSKLYDELGNQKRCSH